MIQFWSGFIPVNGGGWSYPTLTAISSTPTLHFAQFMASFSKPTLLLFFSTCVFHVFFGHPRFLLPFTSNSDAFLKTCPSSSSTHDRTISFHSPLPFEPLFLSIPTSPLGPLSSCVEHNCSNYSLQLTYFEKVCKFWFQLFADDELSCLFTHCYELKAAWLPKCVRFRSWVYVNLS